MDVSNVADPQPAGNYNTNGYAGDVTLSPDGKYAFVADSSSGLQIIDVSNAANPQFAGNYTTTYGPRSVTLSSDGQYAFVGITIPAPDPFDPDQHDLRIINVSNVADPLLVGNLALSDRAQHVTLSSDGQYAYVADGSGGLQVMSLSLGSEGSVHFGGTVDGGHALTVNGTTTFNGEIGNTTPLASLATEGIAASLGGNVTTTGNQAFGSDVTLTGDTKFVSGNLFDLSGLVGGGYNVEIDAVSAAIDAETYGVSGVADLTVSGAVGL
ncbi:MAG: hypothetical protein QGF59_16075, partial [Pirellulaceae bacterium]|nr:hypothetical protein [Pirellulaceae bacterium]